MKHLIKKLAIIFILAALCVPQAFGEDSNTNRRPGRHQGPPPEAFTACEGKSVGDTAEFVSPRGDTVTGTCETCRDGERLVLKPDNDRNEEKGN
ncbi:exported hypothetical protein [Desulfamplus magnetovallimortis]|uniref:Secreted protein n=1 Tax=Desulfamplus magnetovallimortis TaxID=1246637 RepID=A0A1W1HGW8_9BACT|nr:hypothetical protein [Desulfamplus magnetovallimortis]SLM31686.1 exported hypothetical protein [Desulfamplus magnetovallimortis]